MVYTSGGGGGGGNSDSDMQKVWISMHSIHFLFELGVFSGVPRYKTSVATPARVPSTTTWLESGMRLFLLFPLPFTHFFSLPDKRVGYARVYCTLW